MAAVPGDGEGLPVAAAELSVGDVVSRRTIPQLAPDDGTDEAAWRRRALESGLIDP